MPGELADHVYGHCLTVIGEPVQAELVALAALRRAGRSRSSALAHARHQALERATELGDPPSDTPLPSDLTELARLLAATRPPVERALVDLRARLDRADLSRALGMPATAAADEADAAGTTWDDDLDPLLMAAMGPGDCAELAAVLADAGVLTMLGELQAAAGDLTGHVGGCPTCTDRRRAMVSVRGLLAQVSEPAPPSVRQAVRRSRRMRPAPPPPPLVPRAPWARPGRVALIAAAAVIVIGASAATAAALRDGDRPSPVDRLASAPARPSGLVVVPERIDPSATSVELVNRSTRTIRWRAGTKAPWIQLEPASGVLRAGRSTDVAVRVLANAPEGALRASITVTGDDGSVTAATVAGFLERPPDLAALADGCAVTATAEDHSGLAAVELHWRDVAEHAIPMGESEAGFVGLIPPGTAVQWWVTAVDARGNRAGTPEQPANCQ